MAGIGRGGKAAALGRQRPLTIAWEALVAEVDIARGLAGAADDLVTLDALLALGGGGGAEGALGRGAGPAAAAAAVARKPGVACCAAAVAAAGRAVWP